MTRTPITPQDTWLTAGEAAKMLGVTRGTLNRWCDNGLPCIRTLGGHRRVRLADIEAIIAAGTPRGGPGAPGYPVLAS